MNSVKDRIYFPDCSHNDCDADAYFTRHAVFGRFAEEGRAYLIERRDTPRPWLQYLCNDKVRSAVSNTGKGFLYRACGKTVTKQFETNGNYLPRNVNGQRQLHMAPVGKAPVEFFTASEDFLCTVRPDSVTFTGKIDALSVTCTMLVPRSAPCECWQIKLTNTAEKPQDISLFVSQDISECPTCMDTDQRAIRGTEDGVTSLFAASTVTDITTTSYAETRPEGEPLSYLRETLHATLAVGAGETVLLQVISGACIDAAEESTCLDYLAPAIFDAELAAISAKWDDIIARNHCTLPDKNLEYFLNIWLKNQIYLTYRYDRGEHFVGYRDGLQDSWGYMLLEPDVAVEKLLLCLSYMLPDGRCPRQFNRFGDKHDRKDFSDSPTWAPTALLSYIKETGDTAVLDRVLPFLDSNETATVEEHIYRALDYMYRARGKNGLVLVRDGDWADGLSGLNKYGADATSVWVTIAAYHAQNLMAEIYRAAGDTAKAAEMERRSAEYKEIVNRVGWDGNWLVYAFFEDGDTVGSSKNPEGKIWLNPQTWGIFTGIIDDEKKIKRMTDAVSRYLDTPYGAQVLFPPYVFYGERCGRVQRQRPGMFLNGAVYNHGASFKVYADVKRGDYNVAYDTFMRCLPNHPDNPDTRRTSEPYTVGNVYYGPDHSRYGMNLFSWFTATPSWLIHGGFEEILGVKPALRGLEITPHVPDDWAGYKVTKHHRGTIYHMSFLPSDIEKGIWLDGVKQEGNTVYSEKPACEVLVKY